MKDKKIWLTACAVIFNSDKSQVLLMKRRDSHLWALPGGSIEKDETPEQASIRETYEETGYRIKSTDYIGEYWRPEIRNKTYAYKGYIIGGNIEYTDAETIDVRWFKVNAMSWNTLKVHREIIADAFAPDRFPIQKTQRTSYIGLICLKGYRLVAAIKNML